MNTNVNGTMVRGGGDTARLLNVALGVWLIISTYVWRHTVEQQTNLWITGVLAAAFGLIAYFVASKVRYLNTLLAIWLFVSAFVLPIALVGTIWNSVIVAIVMLAVSLAPEGHVGSHFTGPPRAAM